jgi:hypothetical protein
MAEARADTGAIDTPSFAAAAQRARIAVLSKIGFELADSSLLHIALAWCPWLVGAAALAVERNHEKHQQGASQEMRKRRFEQKRRLLSGSRMNSRSEPEHTTRRR